MSDDGTNPYEPPSSDSQTDDVQVGTKKVPNKRISALSIDLVVSGIGGWFLPVAIAWVPGLVYLLLRDALFGGKSVGKYIVGLRVVDMEGQPCSFRGSALRNLILIVPTVMFLIMGQPLPTTEGALDAADFPTSFIGYMFFFSFVYLTEYFVMRFSKEQRRLGDRMAGTKVQDIRPHISDWWFFLLLTLSFVLYSILVTIPALVEGGAYAQ